MDWLQTASLGVKAAPPWLWSLRTKSRETDVCSENAGAWGAPAGCRSQVSEQLPLDWPLEPSRIPLRASEQSSQGLSSMALVPLLPALLSLLQAFGVSARVCLVFSLMFTKSL